jgi:hypothetical protein
MSKRAECTRRGLPLERVELTSKQVFPEESAAQM